MSVPLVYLVNLKERLDALQLSEIYNKCTKLKDYILWISLFILYKSFILWISLQSKCEIKNCFGCPKILPRKKNPTLLAIKS